MFSDLFQDKQQCLGQICTAGSYRKLGNVLQAAPLYVWILVAESNVSLSFQINTGAVIIPPFEGTKRYVIVPEQVQQPQIQVSMPLTISGKLHCFYRHHSRDAVVSASLHNEMAPQGGGLICSCAVICQGLLNPVHMAFIRQYPKTGEFQ